MLTLFRDLFSPPRHAILLIIALWVGLSLAEKRAARHGVGKDDLNNLVFYGLLGFVIGGRLSFVLQNLSAFVKSPLGIFSINPDIFDTLGGLATAFIVALVYGQRRGLIFWNTLDALAPAFAVLSIGLGLSHLAAGSSFGKETDMIWGIHLWNATRHPTQIYETLASFLTAILIWHGKANQRSGILFLAYAALTAFSQLVIQAFRGDSVLIFNGLRQEQIIAWFALAMVFVLLEQRMKNQHG